MRKSSTARRSLSNPGRTSTLERDDRSGGRSDTRRTQIPKSKGTLQAENSYIPKPKIRTSSCDRNSYRPSSHLKPPGKTPLRQPVRISSTTTPSYSAATPSFRASRNQSDLPTGPRGRSPSAERASNFGSKGPRKETRPLTDKAYQNSMLTKIDQYFHALDQTCLLNSNGSLRPITLKMFVETTDCLIKLLNIKQNLTINNYIDDVPKVAKKLLYPGVVMKSWLKTANALHSWPHVLGWLSWLVELCEAREQAEVAFSIDRIPFHGDNETEETHRSTFVSMLKFYKHWNDEKLEEEAALVETHIQERTTKDGDIEKQIEEELLLLEKEKASMIDLDRQEAETDEETLKLNRILEELKCEENLEMKSIEDTLGLVKATINETKQLNDGCRTLEEQIEKDNIDIKEQIIIVNNQAMSVERRDEIINECTEIKNRIHHFGNHIQDIEDKLYDLELKSSKYSQDLYTSILAYNKDIIINLGGDTGADLEALKFPETQFACSDVMDILKTKEAAMMIFKEKIKKEIAQVEAENEAAANELEMYNEKLESLRNENRDYAEKAQEQRVCIQEVQRQAKDTESRLKEQIKHLKSDITQLEITTPDIETASNELAEARDKLEAVIRRSEFAEKRMERFFSMLAKALGDHRSQLNNTLNKLRKNSHNNIQPD